MNPFKSILLLLALIGMLLFVSCGGGATATVAGGGIGGTGRTSSGEVTDIGSIWVNGVRYDTREADLYIDGIFVGAGDQAVIDNLDIGRVVQVNGLVDAEGNGAAAQVYYTPLLVGPIDLIVNSDPNDTLISILGQWVVVSDITKIKGANLNALVPGNVIEASGYIADDGKLYAAFIVKRSETETPGESYIVTGKISALDTVDQLFSINALTVQYDQADVSALSPGGIDNGLLVYVKGRLQSGGDDLVADVIQPHRRLGDVDSGPVELEGIVSQDSATGQFSLEGYDFETTPETLFIGGTAEDLMPGVRIELEGDLSQGEIDAGTITFNDPFRVESDLAGKDVAAGTLELEGLQALVIETSDLTRFSGQVDSFDDLAGGNHVVVKGWLVDDQKVVARQVIGLPQKDKVTLRGTVVAISVPFISVNGVSIDTDTISADEFYMDDEVPISRAIFFNTLQQDDWVQARGTLLPDKRVDWKSITLHPQE